MVGNSACYQHIRFQKGGESRSAPSMALWPRNKSVGAAIFSSLSDVECLQRALNGAKSFTGSERFEPKVGEQNTGRPMERQKQEVEGGTFDLQDLETYEASIVTISHGETDEMGGLIKRAPNRPLNSLHCAIPNF